MKKYILFFLIILAVKLVAQNNSSNYLNKIFKYSSSSKLEIQKLDSMYISASHVEKDKSAFPGKEDSVYMGWVNFLNSIDITLKENNFIWEKKTKVFIKSYFNSNGGIDYLMYNVLDTSFTKNNELEKALNGFIQNYNFGLTCDKKYTQCGNATFDKNK